MSRSRFRVSGTDRTRYLNSQLSNDLRKATPGTALPCCLLTPKGKMCALVWVFEGENTWIIDADHKVRTILQNRLGRYIVTDDVEIEDISESGTLFHIFGPAVSHLVSIEGIRNFRLSSPGLDIWISKNETAIFYKKLIERNIPETSSQFYELLRIEQGIPAWGAEIGEDTLPAEAGLDQIAIDFSKGCYVGQEVVSRIRSVGRVNRQLAGFIAENNTSVLSPGLKIFDSNSKALVGVLTSTAFHSELSRTIALGYLKTGIASTTGLLLAIDPDSGEENPLRTHPFPLNV